MYFCKLIKTQENNKTMQYSFIVPQHINTTIDLPASKSISNRALVIHALSKGQTTPENLSDCDDTEVIMRALGSMPDIIDIKAAGTAMRFMTAYLAVTPGEHVLTGTERMKHRPIKVLVDALRQLGADIRYEETEGFPPLRIKGCHLQGGHLEIEGSVSSQYISALLMIGPMLERGLELRLTGNIVSRPYIDLTLCTMRDFGAEVDWADIDMIKVEPKPYCDKAFFIENDWSASSYWYEIAALLNDPESCIRLTNLMDGSRQGDSAVKYMFSLLGVKTMFATSAPGTPAEVSLVYRRSRLPRLDYDFVNQPDLAQTMTVACTLLGIPFRFTGLGSLKIKETDRIEALKVELRKLGFVLHDRNDNEIFWDGERCTPDDVPVIYTYEDHRMAMAFAPAVFRFPNLRINDPEVVSKSYPHFWEDLQKAGFLIVEHA